MRAAPLVRVKVNFGESCVQGADLGGRCKIRVYFSTTTGNQIIRKNAQALQLLLEREKVHLRPDFEV